MDFNNNIETVALIVSAGRGHRIGGSTPKQYLTIRGEEILTTTTRFFVNHPRVDAVRVVIHPDDEDLYLAATKSFDLLTPVYGGPERQDSVLLGLESLEKVKPSNVLIHDSVRPFISFKLIDEILDKTSEGSGCIPAISINDTIKRIDQGHVVETLDRSGVHYIQTPQGFPYNDILKAHRSQAGQNLTDDAAVAESCGFPVAVIAGLVENEKITTDEDMKKALTISSQNHPDLRVGNGYDVHRFSEGSSLTLCGIIIPHSFSLKGHSDADVGLHALTDAVIGAAGKGDIGTYFPSDEKEWQDTPSHIFLRHAKDLVKEVNGTILSVDVTIVCEEPRIARYNSEMVARISEILSIEVSRVNVKGKTTDKLGFTGRKEGIAAYATATVLIAP